MCTRFWRVLDLAQRGLEPGGPAVSPHQARQRELPAGAGSLRRGYSDPPVVRFQDAGRRLPVTGARIIGMFCRWGGRNRGSPPPILVRRRGKFTGELSVCLSLIDTMSDDQTSQAPSRSGFASSDLCRALFAFVCLGVSACFSPDSSIRFSAAPSLNPPFLPCMICPIPICPIPIYTSLFLLFLSDVTVSAVFVRHVVFFPAR